MRQRATPLSVRQKLDECRNSVPSEMSSGEIEQELRRLETHQRKLLALRANKTQHR